jgi:uncharacterized membrane protein YjgN (DUF898 family)
MEADQSQPGLPAPERFQFTGSGGDYFRIWMVNIALTIVTFGIYSAWAKVRRLQYFYRNTRVAGSSFDYHGPPVAILKGRLIAFGLLVVYNLAEKFDYRIALLVALPIAIAMPWMLRQSLRFRLHYSSWRGLRFAFRGSPKGAYAAFMLWPILTALTLVALGPMWHQRLKRYQHDNSAFGTTPFRFSARIGDFYRTYGKALALMVAPGALAGATLLVLTMGAWRDGKGSAFAALLPFAFMAMFLAFVLLVGPYLRSRIQNLVWNHTTLGPHRFQSTLQARRLAWIAFTNMLLIVATLGLFMPFAAVRLARYRVSCMTLLPMASLDEFVAGERANVAAVGEELGEFLDIDLSL